MDDAIFDVEAVIGLVVYSAQNHFVDRVSVVGVNNFVEGADVVVQKIGRWIARHFQCGLTHKEHCPVLIGQTAVGNAGDVANQGAELLFALAEVIGRELFL